MWTITASTTSLYELPQNKLRDKLRDPCKLKNVENKLGRAHCNDMVNLRTSDLLIGSFLVLIVSQWAANLTPQYWGQDTDHMMYFGQRLLAGEFHWTREFDDKLPVVQLLFAFLS